MKIATNTVVEFCYELEVDGQIVDQCPKERPLDYIHGTGNLLPKLEEAIEGMEPGCTFEATLQPVDAYGEVEPSMVLDLPKKAFEVNGEIREDLLVPGNTIPMLSDKGRVVPGVVIEVTENTVKMDLNHPMAGKTLHFKGEVLSVREATEKELTEGLHGEYVHTCGCGGGCHGHDGGCGGCGGHDGECEGGCGGHDGGCGGHDGGCGGHDGGCGGHDGGCGGHDGGCGCGCH